MILWRYVGFSYLKVFFLSVSTFIAVLMVSRFKDIARFAALSTNETKTALYAAYQIPFILPLAIPLSALTASFLLFQRLSRTQELTAMRTLGIRYSTLLNPLLLIATFLFCGNLWISSELTPYCRREAVALLYSETSSNPLLLFQRQNLIKIRNAYLRIKGDTTSAKNFIFITYNDTNERLGLVNARKLNLEGEELIGQDVAIVSHLRSGNNFDPLIIENQATLSTGAPLLSAALKKNRPRIDNASLPFGMLYYSRFGFSEMMRRSSLSLSVLTFTLLGCAFGIEKGRTPKKWPLIYVLLLTLTILGSYFLGKSMKRPFELATACYFLPHFISWISSLWRFR